MAPGEGINKPPFFDGNEFVIWKWRMENYLGSLGFDVWQAVSTGKVDAMYDSTAKMAITDGLADSVRVRVSGCETAMALWDRLQTLYGDESAFKAHATSNSDSTSEVDSMSSDECSTIGLEDPIPEVDLTEELRAAQDELRLERERLTVVSCGFHNANEIISSLKTKEKESRFVITALEAQVISRDEMCRDLEREITMLRAQLIEVQMNQSCIPPVVEEIARCTAQSGNCQSPSTISFDSTTEHVETSSRPKGQSSSRSQIKTQNKRQRKRLQRHSDARPSAHQAQYRGIAQQREQRHSNARPSSHQALCKGVYQQRAQTRKTCSMQSDRIDGTHRQRPVEQRKFSRFSHQRHRQQVFQQRQVVHTMRHGPTPSWHRHSLVRQSFFHGYCHRCNGYGHRSANCTSRFCVSNYGRKTSTSPQMRPVECLRCHTLGHWAKRCKAVLTPQLAQAERDYQLSRTRKRRGSRSQFRKQAKEWSQFNDQSNMALYSVWRKKIVERSSVGVVRQRQRTVAELVDRHCQKRASVEKSKQTVKVNGHAVWRERHIETLTTPTPPKLGVRGNTPPRH